MSGFFRVWGFGPEREGIRPLGFGFQGFAFGFQRMGTDGPSW